MISIIVTVYWNVLKFLGMWLFQSTSTSSSTKRASKGPDLLFFFFYSNKETLKQRRYYITLIKAAQILIPGFSIKMFIEINIYFKVSEREKDFSFFDILRCLWHLPTVSSTLFIICLNLELLFSFLIEAADVDCSQRYFS